MRKSLRLRLWLAVLFAASSASVQALQLLDARDGVSVAAKLSLQEPTRIKVEGSAIGEVFGNVWQDKANPTGEVIVETDPVKGEIYVRPVSATATKPINLFVSTAHATYTLLLQPVDMPADTIVLRDRTPRVARSAISHGKAPGHVRALTTFLRAMANESPAAEMRIEDTAIDVRLWQDTRFTLLRRYETPGLIGERYLLTNLGEAPLALESRWLDKEGVLAVSVEQALLEPMASTNVFVVRAEAP
jgi:conjugal transfer pilus assembly protein TraK